MRSREQLADRWVDAYRSKARHGLDKIIQGVFPTRTEVADDTVSQVEKLQENEYGVIAIHNHYSLSEGPRSMAVLTETFPHMVTEKVAAPVMETLYRVLYWTSPVFFARQANIDLYGIMTKSSEHIKRDEHGRKINRRKLTLDYLKNSADAVSQGGVALLAPQGTRLPVLSEGDDKRILEALAKFSERKGAKVALLPLAIRPEDPNWKYDKGPNLGVPYIVTILPPIELEDARKIADERGITLDKLGFQLLAPSLPSKLLSPELQNLPHSAQIYSRK
jgi:hypothetical protein